MRQKIAAGNWKMNKTPEEARSLAETLAGYITESTENEVVYCVPFTDISTVIEVVGGSKVKVGAEDMHYEDKGAYTGCISGAMLRSMGVSYVIIGHSERRTLMHETDEEINLKLKKAFEVGLTPILCCGESLSQREAGITIEWVRMQLKLDLSGVSKEDAGQMVIAYEPIWAIGTGKTATSAQAQEVCHAIRELIAELYDADTADAIRILYGGSVSAANAAELFSMPDIDGGLVGGASLKEDFGAIMNA